MTRFWMLPAMPAPSVPPENKMPVEATVSIQPVPPTVPAGVQLIVDVESVNPPPLQLTTLRGPWTASAEAAGAKLKKASTPTATHQPLECLLFPASLVLNRLSVIGVPPFLGRWVVTNNF